MKLKVGLTEIFSTLYEFCMKPQFCIVLQLFGWATGVGRCSPESDNGLHITSVILPKYKDYIILKEWGFFRTIQTWTRGKCWSFQDHSSYNCWFYSTFL